VTRNESVPADLPSEDIRVDIALDWSPAQALAAYEWLGHMQERIWLLCREDIQDLLRDDRPPSDRAAALDEF
jgi:hypothetical protein